MTSSVSNGWLAQRLDMGNAAIVGQYVQHFRSHREHERREFKNILSRFTT